MTLTPEFEAIEQGEVKCPVCNDTGIRWDGPGLNSIGSCGCPAGAKYLPPGKHGHPRFYKLLEQMADLHSRKNHDYAGDDPLSNLIGTEEIGIPAWKGVIVRLMDKWSRLKTFAREGKLEVANESAIDTLLDNAVYSLLCIILLEGESKT